MNRALARARQGRYGYVIEDAGTALRLDARLAGARFVRGVAHANLGHVSNALADFDQLIREEPSNALAYNERGLIRARTGDYDAAIADYDRAIQIDPKLLLPRYNRALAYRLKGDQERAVVEFTEVLQRRPRRGCPLLPARAGRSPGQAGPCGGPISTPLGETPIREERGSAPQVMKASQSHSTSATGAGGDRHRPGKPMPTPPGLRLSVGCSATGQTAGTALADSCSATCKAILHARAPTAPSEHGRWRKQGIWVSVRSFLPGATRHWVPLPKDEQAARRQGRRRRWIATAAALVLAAVGVGGFFFLRSAEAAEELLPDDLAPRAERFVQAWVAKDRPILRRLTSSAHDRMLGRWLMSNPAPTPPEDLEAMRVDVQVVKERGAGAELIVKVGGLSGERSSVQLRQKWERRGGVWFFIPPRENAPLPPIKTAGVNPAPARTPPPARSSDPGKLAGPGKTPGMPDHLRGSPESN